MRQSKIIHSCAISMFCAVLYVALLTTPMTASAVDFLVDSTQDLVDVNPGDGVCDADPGAGIVCTLRAAVQEANALPNNPSGSPPYDRIGILGGTYTLTIAGRDEDAAATGDLDLLETVEIFGDPANRPTIDGGGIDRVFDVLGGPGNGFSVQDVTIRNGSAQGSGIFGTGGGIRCFSSANMLVAKSVVTTNDADVEGGGLHNEGCTFYVVDSLVENNAATGDGGGIGSRFGDLIISGSTVRDNQASPGSSGSSSGGGLDLSAVGDANFTFIYRSSVVGNGADWGAGIDSSMRLYVIDSVVADNLGTYGGGAGIRTFASLDLTGSTIFGNRNTSDTNAAGIFFQGTMPSAVIDHTIVAGNTNASGPADCDGPLTSQGYNLIGTTAGCTITGTTTGNLLDTDPQLIGPVDNPLSAGTAGGRPAWIPRSPFAPPVDAGDPAGVTYDNDADSSTAEVPLNKDQWNEDRPFDGDGDGVARTDIGAIEFRSLFFDGFESGDTCRWTSATGGPACP